MVIPVDAQVDDWSPYLPPGHYRLVPVDAEGRELAREPAVERVIDGDHLKRQLHAFVAEALERAQPRVTDSPELMALLSGSADAERIAVLALAAQRGLETAFQVGNWADLSGPKREQMLETFAATALDTIAHKEAHTTSWFGLDRESLAQLMHSPVLCQLDLIEGSIARADYDDAAVRALARRKLGLPLPPELVAEILVGTERMEVFLPLARLTNGELLIRLLRDSRFGNDTTGIEQTMYATYALWRSQPAMGIRPLLLRVLRGMARVSWLPPRASGIMEWFLPQLDDPHLTAIYTKQHGVAQDKLASVFEQFALFMWNATVDDIIVLLPERPSDPPIAVPTRAPTKVGRNDLCPCGSGKKYKRCCADKATTAIAAPRPSRAEYLRALESRLDRRQVFQLSRADLSALDIPRVPTGAIFEILQRHTSDHDWQRACRAADEITRRLGLGVAATPLRELLVEAARVKRYDVVREVLPRLEETGLATDLELEVDLVARGPEALAQLESAARETMRQRPTISSLQLADVVLRTLPALGILIARGAVATTPWGDADLLLDAIEDARDELELPPGDPAVDIYKSLGGVRKQNEQAARVEEERARLATTTADLQASLERATQHTEALQRQVAELERADQERATRNSDELTIRSLDTERERRALRERIDSLQAMIREGNEERAALRRQLSSATKSTPSPQGSTPAVHQGGDDEDAVEDMPAQASAKPVMIPRFGPKAVAAFDAVPNHVAALAMRTIGELAAGDAAAWRAVKQAKDMPRQVLLGRIGIHYRILFRTDEDVLDVLDLVTRENLMTTLKRIRSM